MRLFYWAKRVSLWRVSPPCRSRVQTGVIAHAAAWGASFLSAPPAAFRGCRSLLLGIKPTFWIVIFSRGRFSRPVCNPALFPFNLRCQARNAWRAIYRCAVVVGFFPWFALELHPLVTSRTIVTSQLRLLIVDFPRHFFRLRSCSEIFESGNFFNLRIRLLFRLRLQSSIQPKFTPEIYLRLLPKLKSDGFSRILDSGCGSERKTQNLAGGDSGVERNFWPLRNFWPVIILLRRIKKKRSAITFLMCVV